MHISSQGVRGLSHKTMSPVWGFYTQKMSSQNIWFWRPAGLMYWTAAGVKGHALTPKAEVVIWKEPGWSPFALILERLQRQKATGLSLGTHTHTHTHTHTRGSRYFWKLVLPRGHMCWQIPNWNPPFSPLVQRACPPTSRPPPVLGLGKLSGQEKESKAVSFRRPVPAPETPRLTANHLGLNPTSAVLLVASNLHSPCT